MEWLKNLFEKKTPEKKEYLRRKRRFEKNWKEPYEKYLERMKKFDEKHGERMRKPQILSKECPDCGSNEPWLRLNETEEQPLELFDHRWICLRCLRIWIDSEHEDPNGWWHTHNSKEEYLRDLSPADLGNFGRVRSSFQKASQDE